MSDYVKITGPAWLLKNKLPNNDPNPFRDDLDYLMRRSLDDDSKIKINKTADSVVISGIQDVEELPLASVLALTAGGCSVEDWPSWVKVLDSDLGNTVPEYLYGAYTTPGEGNNPVLKTWAQWGIYNRPVKGIEESWIEETWIETKSGGAWATGAVITQLHAAGYTILSTQDLLAYLSANETPVEL